jgi:uroporphyrinogen decarboxylase
MFLDAVGPYVMVVETGDDIGAQNNLIISPRMYREFIKPAQKSVNELIREKAPNAKIFMHNDGAITKIIPDLMEIGVEILNPVQPSAAGMESEKLKKDFGDRLIFHGAVDQKPLEGTVQDVRAEVRRRIDSLASGGGYILSTCNHLIDVPCENVIAMFDEARAYGH